MWLVRGLVLSRVGGAAASGRSCDGCEALQECDGRGDLSVQGGVDAVRAVQGSTSGGPEDLGQVDHWLVSGRTDSSDGHGQHGDVPVAPGGFAVLERRRAGEPVLHDGRRSEPYARMDWEMDG